MPKLGVMAATDETGLLRGRPVERLIFDTEDESEIALVVQRFCEDSLGSPARQTLFARTSVGAVFDLELANGRRVVLKAHQPRQNVEFLGAVFEIQRSLADQGFPCPRPVIAPAPIGNGYATVEELVEEGSFADTRRPDIRKTIATALARVIALTTPLGSPLALRETWSLWEGDGVWPSTAHSPIFDFAATAPGAEWIDELAREAKALIPDAGEELIVHSDWSGKHFRFNDDGEITVVYDWDSLTLETELQALGVAAATFTSNFELEVFYAPTPDEVTAFIDEYSTARSEPFSADELVAAHAVAAYLMAYTARCEHALGKKGHFAQSLARFGRAYLGRAERTRPAAL